MLAARCDTDAEGGELWLQVTQRRLLREGVPRGKHPLATNCARHWRGTIQHLPACSSPLPSWIRILLSKYLWGRWSLRTQKGREEYTRNNHGQKPWEAGHRLLLSGLVLPHVFSWQQIRANMAFFSLYWHNLAGNLIPSSFLALHTLTDQPDTPVNTDVLKEGEKYRFCCLSSAGVFSPQGGAPIIFYTWREHVRHLYKWE